MASRLPPFPRLVFTTVEPIALVGGFVWVIASPDGFISEQITQATAVPSSDNSRLVALQLGNLYLLLAMVGVAVLTSTTELKVIRNYLIALWVADIGHVGACYYGFGHQRFMDVTQWNVMTWGNVGITAFLCLTRTAYLLGLFGPDGPASKPLLKQK